MSSETRGVDRYHATTVQYGLSPRERVHTTYRYRTSQAELDSYTSAVKRALMAKGMPLIKLNQAQNYVRRLYRVMRESEPSVLVEAACANAVHWLDAGLSAAELASVAESVLLVQYGMTPGPGQLQQMIEALAAGEREAGKGKEIAMETKEGKSQSAEGTKNETTMNESSMGEPVVALRASELAAKVQEFLATKLENPSDAEPMAKDIAEAVVQGAKPVAAPARHKPLRRARPAPSELSAAGVTGQSTPLERFTKRGATDALRAALSGHQEVVKFVVAGRLCAKKTFDDLAQEYGLTKDEVLDIMTRMRVWVRRFTTYFENDWYWKEGVGKYFIPDPPPIITDRAK